MVEVRGLAKAFRHADGTSFLAVKGIDLTLWPGEIFSLLGPNGAGKTTTISMISGLLTPTRGDALIGGHSITRAPRAAKALLGVVPQEIALYPALTARQNLTFFGRMVGLGGAALARRVDAVLDDVDLRERQHDKVESFSGGMKRRVNLGVGLLHEPKLLYMDEPTVGIDPQNRRRILDTVMRLKREQGMTVLYTSHLMEEVQAISDRVAIIDHGEIIALGTVGELIQRSGGEDRIVFRLADAPDDALLTRLRAVHGISSVSAVGPETAAGPGEGETSAHHTVHIHAARGRQALPALIGAANEAGTAIVSVEVREPDLEAVFLAMTGRALRD
jgi:ABC-2 type transport system ATP-binding protein